MQLKEKQFKAGIDYLKKYKMCSLRIIRSALSYQGLKTVIPGQPLLKIKIDMRKVEKNNSTNQQFISLQNKFHIYLKKIHKY